MISWPIGRSSTPSALIPTLLEAKSAAPLPAAEISLTNVARACLEELLAGYRDFLRTRGLRCWEKDRKEALDVRKLAHGSHVSYETYRPFDVDQTKRRVGAVVSQAQHRDESKDKQMPQN